MARYRITLTGYVDWDDDWDEETALTPVPSTDEELREVLWDMELGISDIKNLELSIRPLTAEEQAQEAEQLQQLIEAARAVGERLRAERAEGEHDASSGK